MTSRSSTSKTCTAFSSQPPDAAERLERDQGGRWGSHGAYLAPELCLLGFARSRETAADLWSCRVTGDGDALAAGLVKVGYGCSQVRAEEAAQAAALVTHGDRGRR